MAAVAALNSISSISSSSSSCSIASCFAAPKPLKPISSISLRSSSTLRFRTLAFSSNLSSFSLSGESAFLSAVEKPSAPRRSVVCEAAPNKKADSAAKRARQAEKRRIYNKAHKSEVKTRMKKVLEELDALRKKNDAKAEEILLIEKLIAEAYSVIDKAVKVGTLHRNTGAHRKSRLARRKKAVEIHHGWYTPGAAGTA